VPACKRKNRSKGFRCTAKGVAISTDIQFLIPSENTASPYCGENYESFAKERKAPAVNRIFNGHSQDIRKYPWYAQIAIGSGTFGSWALCLPFDQVYLSTFSSYTYSHTFSGTLITARSLLTKDMSNPNTDILLAFACNSYVDGDDLAAIKTECHTVRSGEDSQITDNVRSPTG